MAEEDKLSSSGPPAAVEAPTAPTPGNTAATAAEIESIISKKLMEPSVWQDLKCYAGKVLDSIASGLQESTESATMKDMLMALLKYGSDIDVCVFGQDEPNV